METIQKTCLVITIIGAINWGLIGLLDFNLVDAIFGTGLNNLLPEGLQKMIKAANHIEKTVIAIDTPTGIDATTGEVRGAALKAHTTVTFGYNKIGLTRRVGGYLSGNVIVKDIGLLTPPDFSFSDTEENHSTKDV